jgi:hypothetical protein
VSDDWPVVVIAEEVPDNWPVVVPNVLAIGGFIVMALSCIATMLKELLHDFMETTRSAVEMPNGWPVAVVVVIAEGVADNWLVAVVVVIAVEVPDDWPVVVPNVLAIGGFIVMVPPCIATMLKELLHDFIESTRLAVEMPNASDWPVAVAVA